jgi:hypothetical protein
LNNADDFIGGIDPDDDELTREKVKQASARIIAQLDKKRRGKPRGRSPKSNSKSNVNHYDDLRTSSGGGARQE